MRSTEAGWPALDYDEWKDSCATLHRWTQIVGKIRLAHAPLVNHWWQVPLYVTARGLTTSAMPRGARTFQIDFDFIDHRLRIAVSDGRRASLPLAASSVAASASSPAVAVLPLRAAARAIAAFRRSSVENSVSVFMGG